MNPLNSYEGLDEDVINKPLGVSARKKVIFQKVNLFARLLTRVYKLPVFPAINLLEHRQKALMNKRKAEEELARDEQFENECTESYQGSSGSLSNDSIVNKAMGLLLGCSKNIVNPSMLMDPDIIVCMPAMWSLFDSCNKFMSNIQYPLASSDFSQLRGHADVISASNCFQGLLFLLIASGTSSPSQFQSFGSKIATDVQIDIRRSVQGEGHYSTSFKWKTTGTLYAVATCSYVFDYVP